MTKADKINKIGIDFELKLIEKMKYLETKKRKIIALILLSAFFILLAYTLFNLILVHKTDPGAWRTVLRKNLENSISIKHESFSKQTNPEDQNSTYYKISVDKDSVFLDGKLVPDADPKTFKIFDSTNDSYCFRYLFKDKTHVFIKNKIIEEADSETFRFVELYTPDSYDTYCIYADKNYIYIDGEKMGHFDVNSFISMGGGYFKDKNNAYYGFYPSDEIDGVDLETFSGGHTYAEDKNYVYECGEKILPNIDKHELLGNHYGKIGSDVYYKNEIIVEADSETFVLLGKDTEPKCWYWGEYAKDKNNVYFDGKKIEGADIETFTLSSERVGYAKDKNGEYNYGQKVQNDFKLCSSDVDQLPEGKDFWTKIISETLLNTTTGKFEFCLLPDGSKLIGYKKMGVEKNKTIDWFGADGKLIQTVLLRCENQDQSVGEKSIERLEGNTVTLSCVKDEACLGRDFYKLDLIKFKSSPLDAITESDEYYDCGYRG